MAHQVLTCHRSCSLHEAHKVRYVVPLTRLVGSCKLSLYLCAGSIFSSSVYYEMGAATNTPHLFRTSQKTEASDTFIKVGSPCRNSSDGAGVSELMSH